jgi:hypothetical protein
MTVLSCGSSAPPDPCVSCLLTYVAAFGRANDTPNQLRAATARQERRGAAVAAPNNCIGRSDLQLP